MKFIKKHLSLFLIIIELLIILVLKQFVICNKIVSGDSMKNTFNNNDVLIVEKIDKKVKRYDVVIIKTPQKGIKSSVIKRIIGLPNETIQIKNGAVYINNKKLDDDIINTYIMNEGIAKKNIKLKSDEYFVLGDNRNNSEDSRNEWLGLVKNEQIVGKPIMRIYPFNEIELL